jgi:peptidoglycan hydrolase-like protein with peptidoglycan-binding domain
MCYRSRLTNNHHSPAHNEGEKQPFFSQQNRKSHSNPKSGFFQAKLSINSPGDCYEREADAVANTVVNQSGHAPLVLQKKISSIQRLSTPLETNVTTERDKEESVLLLRADLEKEKKKESAPVQTQHDQSTSTASSLLSSQIEQSAGKGNPLPSETMEEMSTSFGTDFSKVRVHHDGEAVAMNKELRAQAFTHGTDIYFNQGRFNPGSTLGKKLLAHELTHTIQQGAVVNNTIQRTMGDGHDLSSPRFAGDRRLEAAFDDEILIRVPSQGNHVRKIQQALVDFGFPLPVYGVDGKFGNETKTAVTAFQQANGLAADGIVGPVTMASLQNESLLPSPVGGALAAVQAPLSSPLPAAVVRKWRSAVDTSDYLEAIRIIADEMVKRGEIETRYFEVQQTTEGSHDCTSSPSLFIVDGTLSGAVTSECTCASTPAGSVANPRIRVGINAIRGSAESLHSTLIHEFRHVRQQYELCNSGFFSSGVCTDCNNPEEMDAYLAEIEAGYTPSSIRHAWVRVFVNWDFMAPSQQNVFSNRKQAAFLKVNQLFPGIAWENDHSVQVYRSWCNSLAGGAVGTCNSFLAPV